MKNKNQTSSSHSPDSYNPNMNSGGYPTFKNSQLVNVIGQPSYDFGTQENLDTFTSLIKSWYNKISSGKLKDTLTNSPHDHKSMAAFLLYKNSEGESPNLFMASQLIWLLNINGAPIYSISPHLAAFSDQIYTTLGNFLAKNAGINIDAYTKYTVELYKNNSKVKDTLPSDLFVDNKLQPEFD